MPSKKIPKTVIYALLISICFIYGSCSENIKKNNDVPKIIENNNTLTKEYLREGFISKDIFRIVIVEPKREKNDGRNYIIKTAKRRAFVSLQKYITANNAKIDNNINASLLNLVEECGTLKSADINHKTRRVHLFEIKKSSLKQSIDNLARSR